MKQSLRFNLLFVLVFLIGLLVSGVFARKLLDEEARGETVNNALLMMESALAVRSYTIDVVQPLLSASNATDFQSASVPAFAATQTFKRLQKKYPDFVYREAVLNPTNRDNLARDWEKKLIERFKNDSAQTEVVGERSTDAGPSMYVARPIQIKNPACLACHSTPQAAPASLVQQYGAQGGFGWQHNELIGVQVVSVPIAVPMSHANRLFGTFLGMYVGIFGVLLVALNIPIRRWMAEQQQRQMQLESVQQQLKALNVELAQQSTTDTLTGLKNRREFDRALLEETARVVRSQTPLGLLLVDVDHFKPYNDNFGHVAGDAALAQVGRILLKNARTNDLPVRYGGEEFAVLLPDTDKDGAMAVAQRIRAAIEGADWPLRVVTVSIGVAISSHADDNPSLVKRADQALYEAKRQGRNCVIHLEAAPEP
jgi:two-component system cell cycle response regulator